MNRRALSDAERAATNAEIGRIRKHAKPLAIGRLERDVDALPGSAHGTHNPPQSFTKHDSFGRCMRPGVVIAGLATILLPLTAANHDIDCIVSSADPATYLVYELDGRIFYEEERGNPFGTPIPATGILFRPDPPGGDGIPDLIGRGTWIYEESNLVPGLQRGGTFTDCVTVGTETVCRQRTDPLTPPDETCQHGPDFLWFGFKL